MWLFKLNLLLSCVSICVCLMQTVLLKHYSVLELPSLVVELSNGDHHVIPGYVCHTIHFSHTSHTPHSHSLKEPYETFKKMVLKYLDILHSPPPKEQRKPVSKPHPQDSNPTHSQFTPVKINRYIQMYMYYPIYQIFSSGFLIPSKSYLGYQIWHSFQVYIK